MPSVRTVKRKRPGYCKGVYCQTVALFLRIASVRSSPLLNNKQVKIISCALRRDGIGLKLRIGLKVKRICCIKSKPWLCYCKSESRAIRFKGTTLSQLKYAFCLFCVRIFQWGFISLQIRKMEFKSQIKQGKQEAPRSIMGRRTTGL